MSLYKEFTIQYKNLSGDWKKLPEQEILLEDTTNPLQYFTLSSNPLELRVDWSSPTLSALYVSENNVQWHVDNNVIVRGRDLKYSYTNTGKKSVQVYIGRSSGEVISRGNSVGEQQPIPVIVKNILGTNIEAVPNPSVDQQDLVEDAVQSLTDVTGATFQHKIGTKMTSFAGRPSMPINILTSHTWQLYDEDIGNYGVDLYADNAGLRYTIEGVPGNNSSPLVTNTYDDNKYAQFQKSWRFTTDPEGLNPVDSITTTTENIYARKNDDSTGFVICSAHEPGAEFVGTTGTDTVYYIDDTSAFVDVSGAQLYRLMFSLNTRGWPDKDEQFIDTKTITQAPGHPDLPQLYQSQTSTVFINVSANDPAYMRVTPSGIISPIFQGMGIKFQDSLIPFFTHIADVSGNIIKSHEGFEPTSYEVRIPWTVPDASTMNPGTVYVGLDSSDAAAANVSITTNNQLSSIPLYSTAAFVLSSDSQILNTSICCAVSSLTHGVLSGKSAPFDIYSNTGRYNFFKQNEHIDYGSIVNSYILQETINQHTTLSNIFDSVLGNFESDVTSLGKVLYEKISNFTANNTDVDVCNVRSIYSLAHQVNLELENYNFMYPGGMQRLVDVLSVGIKKLIGNRDMTTEDYVDEPTSYEGNIVKYGRNVSDEKIDPATYLVTAGVPIIVKELFGNNFFKVIPNHIPADPTADYYDTLKPFHITQYNLDAMSKYPLSAYDNSWNWGLTWPTEGTNKFSDYYDFYEYFSNTEIDNNPASYEQVDGVIDWDNTAKLGDYKHVLTEEQPTYEEWYGESGIVEHLVEYTLQRGLNLIDK